MKIPVPIYLLRGVLLFILSSGLFLSGRSQNIDFGKSYINVTKGINGGTVEPGDVLEIRASIVVRSGTYDSCGYFDAVPAGTSYITNTIRVLTNEGKIYKQFTDAAGDDQGWISGGSIRINLGFNAAAVPGSAFRRGRILNTHKPSFYGSTCIMIASFRVTVTASYGTTISIGGGSMSYKPTPGSLTSFAFPSRTIAVFQNYGICPNAVGANSLGTEFNGTFGSGKPRNRGVSANVPAGYTYNIFTSGGPNDYYYGIPNNTSINTGYTTLNNWPKPDNTHRVFGVWDIIGDHTGASNPLVGNAAADTVSNSNAGYMLVINAAYRIDSAFQQTISGLCPNTYYEISCWMRNICSKCGCDSNGTGAGGGSGYIPTAPSDSSGVYPNLSFNVDGVDYYTTGNLLYTGQWVKKGFTILTGPSQTSFTLKFFNNAPGGGGNDWALDDISVATCSPNLAFTPSNNPTVCEGNVVDLGAYVRSYFNNYIYYRWQKSTDNGLTWNNVGSIGTGTPTWNGSAWEYFTAYPSFVATIADNSTKYRVVVASTASNISSSSCSFADVTSILTLNVITCGLPLSTDFISFHAKTENGTAVLKWTTNRESGLFEYEVEKSVDGVHFNTVARVSGIHSDEDINSYHWFEPLNTTAFYRIRLKAGAREKISEIKMLSLHEERTGIQTVLNPFGQLLSATITATEAKLVQLQLIDPFGRVVISQSCTLSAGNNVVKMDNTAALPGGLYTLQLIADGQKMVRKVVKQ